MLFLDTAGTTRTTIKLNKSQDLEEDGEYWVVIRNHQRIALLSESFNSTSQSLGPGAYGLPSSIRQADSVPMVETTNRFMSLSSRPVTVPLPTCASVPTSGYNTPLKKSSIGGKGRQVRGLGSLLKLRAVIVHKLQTWKVLIFSISVDLQSEQIPLSFASCWSLRVVGCKVKLNWWTISGKII